MEVVCLVMDHQILNVLYAILITAIQILDISITDLTQANGLTMVNVFHNVIAHIQQILMPIIHLISAGHAIPPALLVIDLIAKIFAHLVII